MYKKNGSSLCLSIDWVMSFVNCGSICLSINWVLSIFFVCFVLFLTMVLSFFCYHTKSCDSVLYNYLFLRIVLILLLDCFTRLAYCECQSNQFWSTNGFYIRKSPSIKIMVCLHSHNNNRFAYGLSAMASRTFALFQLLLCPPSQRWKKKSYFWQQKKKIPLNIPLIRFNFQCKCAQFLFNFISYMYFFLFKNFNLDTILL